MKKIFGMLLALVLLFSIAYAQNVNIGIIQFAAHPSLDNCTNGFIEGLKEAGFEDGKNISLDIQIANADMGLTNQLAQKFASQSNMICAVATPAAQAALNAAMDKNVSVIYTAVSDPIKAEVANADGKSQYAITGTSDVLPVEAQLYMIRAILPNAKKLGILYTTSEVNSVSSLNTYKELATKFDFEIISEGVAVAADIPLALAKLLPQVDCTTNLTDNTVVSSLPIVLELSKEAGKPVFGSEIEQVKNGCVAAMGIDYFELGKQTGQMAARVLNGEFAGDIPFEAIKNSALFVNSKELAEYGIEVDKAILENASDVAN